MRIRARISMFLVPALFLLSSPVDALSEEEIQVAIQQGLDAEKEREVPPFLKVGSRRVPTGSSGGGAYYFFYIGSCKQRIRNLAFEANQAMLPVDVGEARDLCLGTDEVRVVVAAVDDAGLLSSGPYRGGKLPVPTDAVIAIRLEIDGVPVEPASIEEIDSFGEGNACVAFDPEKVRGATELRIVATIATRVGGDIEIARKVRQQILSELF